jgi:hypothetical protein
LEIHPDRSKFLSWRRAVVGTKYGRGSSWLALERAYVRLIAIGWVATRWLFSGS